MAKKNGHQKWSASKGNLFPEKTSLFWSATFLSVIHNLGAKSPPMRRIYDVNLAYRPVAHIDNFDAFNSFTGVKYGFWEAVGVKLIPAGIQDGLPPGHFPSWTLSPQDRFFQDTIPHIFSRTCSPSDIFHSFPDIFISITHQTI